MVEAVKLEMCSLTGNGVQRRIVLLVVKKERRINVIRLTLPCFTAIFLARAERDDVHTVVLDSRYTQNPQNHCAE